MNIHNQQVANIFENIKCKVARLIFLPKLKDWARELIFLVSCKRKLSTMRPIFIVGCGHSGTSIMLAILGSHKSIYPVPYESRVFLDEPNFYISKIFFKWHLKCVENKKTRIIEKTPYHILELEKIFYLFPNCKVLIMIRDGRDVACSIKQRYGDIIRGTQRWVESMNILEAYEEDPRVKSVKLEELVADPELVLQDVCVFLEEQYDPNALCFYKTDKYYYSGAIEKPSSCLDGPDHRQLRNWQINQPLFKSTMRWKNEMDDSEISLVEEIAGEQLRKFGYA